MSNKRAFSELSINEVEELCKQYDAGVKIKDIIAAFDLEINSSGLSKLLPPKKTEEKCIYCNIPMEIRRTRNSYSYDNFPKCPNCNHINYIGWTYQKCNCENCILAEYNRLKDIRDEIENAFPKPDYSFKEDELHTIELSILLFLMCVMGSDKNGFSLSFKYLSYDLNSSALEYLIESLFNKGLIYIDVKKTSIDCFDVESLPPKYEIEEVVFGINVEFSEESLNRLMGNDYSLYSLSSECKKKALLFFMLLSLNINLYYLMHERGFNQVHFEPDKHKKMLKTISYNDIRYLQYKQAEYALHLKYVDHVPDSKICKSISSMIYNSYTRHLTEGWEFYSPSLEYVEDIIRIFVCEILKEDIGVLKILLDEIYS